MTPHSQSLETAERLELTPATDTAPTLKSYAHKADTFLNSLGTHLQSAVLLGLRLTWGWSLLESGYGHLTHVQKTVEAFRGWGIPFPTANVYLSGTMELLGGLLLILGLAARWVSVPLVFNFLVAYATASRDTLKQVLLGPGHLEGYDAFIADAAFPMLALAFLILAFGPGRWSLDSVLSHRSKTCRTRAPGFPVGPVGLAPEQQVGNPADPTVVQRRPEVAQ